MLDHRIPQRFIIVPYRPRIQYRDIVRTCRILIKILAGIHGIQILSDFLDEIFSRKTGQVNSRFINPSRPDSVLCILKDISDIVHLGRGRIARPFNFHILSILCGKIMFRLCQPVLIGILQRNQKPCLRLFRIGININSSMPCLNLFRKLIRASVFLIDIQVHKTACRRICKAHIRRQIIDNPIPQK